METKVSVRNYVIAFTNADGQVNYVSSETDVSGIAAIKVVPTDSLHKALKVYSEDLAYDIIGRCDISCHAEHVRPLEIRITTEVL